MAVAARDIPRMSATEYLQMERQAASRHEFVNGIVYARAGASRRHNTIALEITTALLGRLSLPCRAFALEVKVHVASQSEEQFYYPDAVVTCTDIDSDPYLIRFPSLIVEVLSRTTEDADRGYKFEDYKKLPSLQEYALVHQAKPCVELYRRRTGWLPETSEPDAEISFESVGASVPIPLIYRRVSFAGVGDQS